MFEIFRKLFGLGQKAVENITGSGKESRAQQTAINQAEISGAPQSVLRLWRSALGWALVLCFLWEVIARPVIVTYWPDVTLPPSFIGETTSMLLGLLGLGF